MKTWHFILQWHITAACPLRCAHCYLFDEPTYESESRHPLSTAECERVMDDFVAMLARLSVEHGIDIRPRIHFTGGDPLLRPDFFDLLQAARRRSISAGILGNPYQLTDEVACRLRELGVRTYQISVDGLEATHDSLRRDGSFAESLRALETLQRAGIADHVMFTLSPRNAPDLIPVVRLMCRIGVQRFDFARVASAGAARNLSESFSPQEYRNLLLAVYAERKRLVDEGARTHFGLKDHLWTLLRYELGEFAPCAAGSNGRIHGGCTAGLSFLVLLADGTIYACRRFPSPIGNVRTDGLYHVFRASETLRRFRRPEVFEKCRSCELRWHCRGCPAVAAGANGGNFLAPDPQCWWAPRGVGAMRIGDEQ